MSRAPAPTPTANHSAQWSERFNTLTRHCTRRKAATRTEKSFFSLCIAVWRAGRGNYMVRGVCSPGERVGLRVTAAGQVQSSCSISHNCHLLSHTCVLERRKMCGLS